jgi:uncharacterized lipoprotein YbaY
MSLINEALKRARESQTDMVVPPPASNLQFKQPAPSETGASSARHWPIFTLAGLALLGTVYALRLATLKEAAATAPLITAQARTSAPEPLPDVGGSVLVRNARAVPDEAALAEERYYFGDEELYGSGAQAESAPYKLQAIIFQPRHPLAIVSGKSLFIGDKLGDLRVYSITKNTVTLVNNSQTNTLRLEQ